MNPVSPRERFEFELRSGERVHDPAQAETAAHLDTIYHQLTFSAEQGDWWSRLQNRISPLAHHPVRGLYLWGGVGRGKTWLMDLFFESLKDETKQRFHFHRFMQHVHYALRQHKEQRNPLALVAQSLASKARVLCLDEFFVIDIADAMLLSGLLEGLFSHGVCVITTSNIEPDELYHGGLQRARFVPAIALIKRHMEVVQLEGETDFRLSLLAGSPLYRSPLDDAADLFLRSSFQAMAPTEFICDSTLDINGRKIAYHYRGGAVIWFTFWALCQAPRGAADYIEIARCFNTVLLSDVPQMGDQEDDAARRFVTLIDELYDRKVNLLITAEAPLGELYSGSRLSLEFERTESRLNEMQTRGYLHAEHGA